MTPTPEQLRARSRILAIMRQNDTEHQECTPEILFPDYFMPWYYSAGRQFSSN